MSAITGIYARETPRLNRFVQVGIASGKVVQVSFPESPDPEAESEHDLLDRLLEYIDGRSDDEFDDVTVALTLPTDQRAVLETLQSVPYDNSITVDQLVRTTPGLAPDEENSEGTVRAAIGANPAPILIPDHRVRDATGATPSDVRSHLRSMEDIDR